MIKIKDVQINSLNLYYTEELTALKAEAVSQAEKMHAAGDYTAAAEYSTMAGKISDELTARGETPVEVGYLVYVDGWDKGRRYVWDAAEIEDGGLCDCPNGYKDLFDTEAEADQLKEEVEDYIEVHDYILTVGIEEVVKS